MKNHTQKILNRKEESSLELTVKVIDINADSKADLLKKCPVLNEYAQFVSWVRHYKDQGVEESIIISATGLSAEELEKLK